MRICWKDVGEESILLKNVWIDCQIKSNVGISTLKCQIHGGALILVKIKLDCCEWCVYVMNAGFMLKRWYLNMHSIGMNQDSRMMSIFNLNIRPQKQITDKFIIILNIWNFTLFIKNTEDK